MMTDMAQFLDRLAEVIPWCNHRTSISDPADSLRSHALKPRVVDEKRSFEFNWEDTPESQGVVGELVAAHAELLRLDKLYPSAIC